jgi:hypothetical protein
MRCPLDRLSDYHLLKKYFSMQSQMDVTDTTSELSEWVYYQYTKIGHENLASFVTSTTFVTISLICDKSVTTQNL